jgi:hypothetical protein
MIIIQLFYGRQNTHFISLRPCQVKTNLGQWNERWNLTQNKPDVMLFPWRSQSSLPPPTCPDGTTNHHQIKVTSNRTQPAYFHAPGSQLV